MLKRLGFLAGEIDIPKDFDRMGDKVIAAMFGHDRSRHGTAT